MIRLLLEELEIIIVGVIIEGWGESMFFKLERMER